MCKQSRINLGSITMSRLVKSEGDVPDLRLDRKCMICGKKCSKARRLPCNDHFCKKCLSIYIAKLPCVNMRTLFPCPHCSQEIPAPNRPATEWTKDFKLKSSCFFYSDFHSLSVEENNDHITIPQDTGACVNSNKCAKKVNGVAMRPPSVKRGKPKRVDVTNDATSGVKGSRPSGMLFQGYEYSTSAFESHVSSDNDTCQYWGGDLLPSGGFVALADWKNSTVKIFNHSWDCKASFKVQVCKVYFWLFKCWWHAVCNYVQHLWFSRYFYSQSRKHKKSFCSTSTM